MKRIVKTLLSFIALATLLSCTKTPKQSRTAFDCSNNPEKCNGGVDPTTAGGSLDFTVPSSVGKNQDFDITWGVVPGATKFDLTIANDEKCTNIVLALKDIAIYVQKLSMPNAGTFYACLDAKSSTGTVIARKEGYKFVVTSSSTDPGFTAPSNLRISADSAAGSTHSSTDDDTTIYFIWDAATDATNGIKSYSLKYYAAAGCLGTATEVNAGSGTSYTFSSANYTSTYSFQVTALNNASETKTSSCSNSTTINYPTHTITFDTPANYTYDNTLLSVSGGVATLLAITQTYDDNSSSEFGLTKAHNNTAWDIDHLELKNAGAPDPRPLPNDFYYGVDASNLQILTHFDDPNVQNTDTLISDFGINGTYSTNNASVNKSVAGKHGRAISSDGSGDYVDYGDIDALDGLTQITLVAWVKATSVAGGVKIIAKSNVFEFSIDGFLDPQFRVWGSGSTAHSSGGISPSITDGAWHQLVGTYDGSKVRIYHNGSLAESSTIGSVTMQSNANTLRISENILGLNGSIDELAIFSRALSATEIATLYQNQVKNFTYERWTEAPGLMDGNVLLLHMDETSGNLVDYSGLGNDGTVMGSPIFSQTGKVGNTLDFNGTTDYIQLPQSSSLKPKNLSFSVWVNFPGTGNAPVITWDDGSGKAFRFSVKTGGAPQGFTFENDTGAGGAENTTFHAETTWNVWYHVAGTYDGTTTSLYVDGILRSSDSTNSGDIHYAGFGEQRLNVMYDQNTANSHRDGKIDELAIWNRALSPQEIQTIYNLQSGNYRGNVHELPNDQDQTVDAWFPMNGNVLLMHMDETSIIDSGTNPTVYDYSGNGNHGVYNSEDDGAEKSLQGQHMKAFDFDGTNDRVMIADTNNTLDLSGTFTLGAWVKFDSLPTNSGDRSVIVEKYNTATLRSWTLYAYNDGGTHAIHTYLSSNGGTSLGANYQFNHQLPTGIWSHIYAVYDKNLGAGLRWKLYVNGTIVPFTSASADSAADPFLTNEPVCIGGYNNNTNCISAVGMVNGSIDELAIWNRALSEDEIRKIYDHQSAKYSGTFTSDVIDTGTTSASWTTLAWNMIRPYGKELGASSDLSSSYTALPNDNLMNGNVLLMHFNETGEDTVGSGPTYDIEDFSGNGHHGNTSGGPTYKAQGKFGYAMEFDGDDDYIDMGDIPQEPTNAISISLWFFPQDKNNNGATIFATKGGWSFTRVSPNANSLSWIAGGSTCNIQATTSMIENSWNHLAMTWDDTQSNATFFVNGVSLAGSNITDCTGAALTSTDFLEISHPTDEVDGLLDEVAIWNRALSASEVTELYRRGASRVRYKIRTCDASGCDDEPWIVPDNTLTPYSSTGEFFSELHNTTTSNPSLTFGGFGSHTVSNNQFFQWKAYLDTSDTSEIPELKSVTVGPTHYPGSNPTIVTSNALTFSSLISFTETSTTGTVKYQLSNDGGTTWYYYNSGWTTTTSGYTNSNTATDINTNIATFPVGSGSLLVKAFLNSSAASQATDLSGIDIQYQP